MLKIFSTLNNLNYEFDYYCFADQDDIWEIEKTNRAINNLKKFNLMMLLYFRTAYFNENCTARIGESNLFTKTFIQKCNNSKYGRWKYNGI